MNVKTTLFIQIINYRDFEYAFSIFTYEIVK